MLGPKPRVIADDAWAKILWAGLNLTAGDLGTMGTRAYPLELVRALALTWLFAAQRSDEIARLRVGCIRWQPGDSIGPAAEPVCLLDVPCTRQATRSPSRSISCSAAPSRPGRGCVRRSRP